MSRNWGAIALATFAIGLCMALAGGVGLWTYMGRTAEVLHPSPAHVPAVTRSAPATGWAAAVDRGRALARSHVSARNLPGLSVAVGVGDAVVWAEGFGWAEVEERLRVTPETTFRIGTASTALTAAAVGLLLEEGRLALDEELRTYVPEFPAGDLPLTIRYVMGHVAGLRSDGGDEGPLFTSHCERPLEAFPHFAERPLLFTPGTEYLHSNYGWIAVSAALEAAAGEPFLRLMRKRVFEPLGMDDTRADDASRPDGATAYFPRFAADPRYGLDAMREIDLSCYAGAGVFASTPTDLVRFGLALVGGQLLRPATVDVLLAPVRLAAGGDSGHGLGWDREPAPAGAEPVIGHHGDVLGGQVASLLVVPARRVVVAVISNTSYADTASVAAEVLSAFVDQRHTPAEP